MGYIVLALSILIGLSLSDDTYNPGRYVKLSSNQLGSDANQACQDEYGTNAATILTVDDRDEAVK